MVNSLSKHGILCYNKYTYTLYGYSGSRVDKEDYLLAMERSPIKDVEIKVLLKNALTDQINDREVYMKGIDASYHYEGYHTFKTENLL